MDMKNVWNTDELKYPQDIFSPLEPLPMRKCTGSAPKRWNVQHLFAENPPPTLSAPPSLAPLLLHPTLPPSSLASLHLPPTLSLLLHWLLFINLPLSLPLCLSLILPFYLPLFPLLLLLLLLLLLVLLLFQRLRGRKQSKWKTVLNRSRMR